jgi:hypothetical protein
LLSKDLSEGDHLSIVTQGLGEGNKFVCSILLITVTSGRKQGLCSGDGKRVALLTTARSILPRKNQEMAEKKVQ